MLTETSAAVTALDGFATYLDALWTPNVFTTQIGGWNIAPLSRSDLSSRVRILSARISGLSDEDINDDLKRKLGNIPYQTVHLQTQTMTQLSSGNMSVVLSIFDSVMANVEQSIPEFMPFPEPTWEEIRDSGKLPRDLARKLTSLQARLSILDPQTETLAEKITEIEAAHGVAIELPADLAYLRSVRSQVDDALTEVRSQLSTIIDLEKTSDQLLQTISGRDATSAEIMRNLGQAYGAATSHGLSRSFQERANALSKSTWMWVAGLVIALISGGVIGSLRVGALERMMLTPNVSTTWMILNALIAIGSVAAPIWFAWLSTRQISQRFRLSEDYGFKAAVARAYEGYRIEASRIDPALEKRLFTSALERLEEAPLRFVSVEEHSSPYEALFASVGFQKLIDKIPTVDKARMFSKIIRNGTKEKADNLAVAADQTAEEDEREEEA